MIKKLIVKWFRDQIKEQCRVQYEIFERRVGWLEDKFTQLLFTKIEINEIKKLLKKQKLE